MVCLGLRFEDIVTPVEGGRVGRATYGADLAPSATPLFVESPGNLHLFLDLIVRAMRPIG